MMRARFKNQSTVRAKNTGSAALEVLLIVVVFIVPIWMLLFNMGYNGVRHRQAQAALRTGAFLYVDKLGEMSAQKAADATETQVHGLVFKGEPRDVVNLTYSGQQSGSTAQQDLPDTQGILSQASFRQGVAVAVKRTPPYDIFPSSELKGSLIIATNTFTYCEMKDDDFGGVNTAMQGAEFFLKYGLWLFGGCGGEAFDFKCKDVCGT